MRKTILIIIVLIAVGLFGLGTVNIQPTTNESDLEARVASLEDRVDRLEALLVPEEAATRRPASSGDWEDRANWRQLETGMTESQVKVLLGEPDRISGGTYVTRWFYGSSLSGGSVGFDRDMRVSGWREP